MVTLVKSTTTITLPNPVFGDSEWFESSVIIRKNKGQEVLVASDANWSDVTRYSLTFRFVSADVVSDLLDFLYDYAGDTIVYTDYRGTAHNVIILTPTNNVVQEGNEECTTKGRRNVSLELEVV